MSNLLPDLFTCVPVNHGILVRRIGSRFRRRPGCQTGVSPLRHWHWVPTCLLLIGATAAMFPAKKLKPEPPHVNVSSQIVKIVGASCISAFVFSE